MCNSNYIRVEALAERARRARGSFLPPEDPPDRDRALEYLRDGVSPAVALYREASMDGQENQLDAAERQTLDRALNDWLELYAACYGIHIDASASVTDAAALLADGSTLRETAIRLTGVPGAATAAVSTPPRGLVGSTHRSDRG